MNARNSPLRASLERAEPSLHVRKEFFENLDDVVWIPENDLIKPMVAQRANKKIIMHGYDYVIPRPRGSWLGGPMEYQGLHPTFNAKLYQAIIKLMIDAYNMMLGALASRNSITFIYLNLRGAVAKTEWWDELHGKDSAAKKIARKFAQAIDGVKFTTQQAAIARVYIGSSRRAA